MKSVFFLVSQVLSSRLSKKLAKNLADTTSKVGLPHFKKIVLFASM